MTILIFWMRSHPVALFRAEGSPPFPGAEARRGLDSRARVGQGRARVGRRRLRIWSQSAPPAQCPARPRQWVGAPKRAGRSLPARGHQSPRKCEALRCIFPVPFQMTAEKQTLRAANGKTDSQTRLANATQPSFNCTRRAVTVCHPTLPDRLICP